MQECHINETVYHVSNGNNMTEVVVRRIFFSLELFHMQSRLNVGSI